MPYQQVIDKASKGIIILSTPFLKPNSLRKRKQSGLMKRISSEVDAIEVYNQNLFWNTPNRQAARLARDLQIPGVSVSDAHSYACQDKPLNLSGIVLRRDSVDFTNSAKFISSLKNQIAQQKFHRHETFDPRLLLEICSLDWSQIKRLYTGK